MNLSDSQQPPAVNSPSWEAGLECFFAACFGLILEFINYRIFAYIFAPTWAFFSITIALVGGAFAGFFVYKSKRPAVTNSFCFFLFSALCLLSVPYTNALVGIPGDFLTFPVKLIFVSAFLSFSFFFLALVIVQNFKNAVHDSPKLYSYDLLGAGVGCIAWLLFFIHLGPVRFLLVLSILSSFVSLLRREYRYYLIFFTFILIVYVGGVFGHPPNFLQHVDKRNVIELRRKSPPDVTIWDPVSTLEVFRPSSPNQSALVLYDGGNIQTNINRFNGDFQMLRRSLDVSLKEWWQPNVLLCHFLKKDIHAKTLIISGAGGRELLGALTFQAGHVDVVDIVPSVMDIAKKYYADFNGRIFLDPRVRTFSQDARVFLRTVRNVKYDVIQLNTPTLAGSVWAGTLPVATTVLMTQEAFEDYISHLTEDGILQINHPFIIRMTRTALAAWKNLGGKNFAKHILLITDPKGADKLPTLLFKRSEWTKDEIAHIDKFLNLSQVVPQPPKEGSMYWLWNGQQLSTHLPPDLFSEVKDPVVPFKVSPVHDQGPFFRLFDAGFSLKEVQANPYSSPMIIRALAFKAGPFGLAQWQLFNLLVLSFGIFLFIISKVFRPRMSLSFDFYFILVGIAYSFIQFSLIFLNQKIGGNPAYALTATVSGMLFGASLRSQWLGKNKADNTIFNGFAFVVMILYLGLLAKTPGWWCLGDPGIGFFIILFGSFFVGWHTGYFYPKAMLTLKTGTQISLSWLNIGFGSLLAGGLYISIITSVGIWWLMIIGVVGYLGAMIILRVKGTFI